MKVVHHGHHDYVPCSSSDVPAASVPPYAVGPALITVGALMMMNAVRIKWDQAGEALPAFATIIITPLTYSISYGAAPLPITCLISCGA